MTPGLPITEEAPTAGAFPYVTVATSPNRTPAPLLQRSTVTQQAGRIQLDLQLPRLASEYDRIGDPGLAQQLGSDHPLRGIPQLHRGSSLRSQSDHQHYARRSGQRQQLGGLHPGRQGRGESIHTLGYHLPDLKNVRARTKHQGDDGQSLQ